MKLLLILLQLILPILTQNKYQIFITKINLNDPKYPAKKISAREGEIELLNDDFSVKYKEEETIVQE